MGKFAELCKGKTMGAFFLLLLRRCKLLGHYTFVTGCHDLLIARRPGTDHRVRKLHLRHIQLFAHIGQHLSPPRQRLLHQATP